MAPVTSHTPRRRRALLLALVGGAIACLLLAPVSATASPGSQLVPRVTCVTVNDDGTLTARFGFTNNWPNQETVPIGFHTGSVNAFSPAPEIGRAHV